MFSKNLRGYTVYYEKNAEKGIEHLAYVLNFDESESLFRAAKLEGKIEFEDRYGHNFTLISNLDGTFKVVIR
ncbi:hypothetical protein J7K86_02345 [bacterium]|nr:hypothetical protein [bacterium]